MQMRIMMTLTSLTQKRPILFPDKKINTTRTKQTKTAIVFLTFLVRFFFLKIFIIWSNSKYNFLKTNFVISCASLILKSRLKGMLFFICFVLVLFDLIFSVCNV